MHPDSCYIFDSSTANKAAKAVIEGQFESIIHFHLDKQNRMKRWTSTECPKTDSYGQVLEESKHSGYAKFYQIKRKEFKSASFGQASTLISASWNKLSVEEKSAYGKDVRLERKRLLRKQAMQQAQELLVREI